MTSRWWSVGALLGRLAAIVGSALAALCALAVPGILRWGHELNLVPRAAIPPSLWLWLGTLAWAVAGASLLGALGAALIGRHGGRLWAAGLLVLAGSASLLPVLWLSVWFASGWEAEGGYVWWRVRYVFGIFQPFYLLPAGAFLAFNAAAVMALRPLTGR